MCVYIYIYTHTHNIYIYIYVSACVCVCASVCYAREPFKLLLNLISGQYVRQLRLSKRCDIISVELVDLIKDHCF